MAEVRPAAIPASAVQHAALDHDIRAAALRKELDKSHQKSTQLDAFRTEMKAKVDTHMEELHTLDATKERTAQFKEEMLQKVNEHLSELEKEMAKKEEVAKIKAELMAKVHRHTEEIMAKVHRHTEELEQMDAKNADLQKYKSELMVRIEEHIKEHAHAEEKGAQVRRLSVEMSSKVREYQDHLAERARISTQLKGEISKDLAQKFKQGNEFTNLLDQMQ